MSRNHNSEKNFLIQKKTSHYDILSIHNYLPIVVYYSIYYIIHCVFYFLIYLLYKRSTYHNDIIFHCLTTICKYYKHIWIINYYNFNNFFEDMSTFHIQNNILIQLIIYFNVNNLFNADLKNQNLLCIIHI